MIIYLFIDENSFGSKMLAKMGWAPGKGLGAREDGKLDFIKVKYKHDAEGIGYEARDDQWTEHANGFNQLLSHLSNAHSKGSDEEEIEAHSIPTTNKSSEGLSGESLEFKSKNSKARVHYKKFTRGKDLTQYSKKDLANIFGKRDLTENVVNKPNGVVNATTENVSSVPMVVSQYSIQDYFDNKKHNKSYKNCMINNTEKITQIQNKEIIDTNTSIIIDRKKSCKKKRSKKDDETKSDDSMIIDVKSDEHLKKSKNKTLLDLSNNDNKRKEEHSCVEQVSKPKRKKSKVTYIEETLEMQNRPEKTKQLSDDINESNKDFFLKLIQ